MNVDPQQVIHGLLQQIANLSLENAKLNAALAAAQQPAPEADEPEGGA